MVKKKQNRARTRAIRARMERTGEPYTLAARRHDEERGAVDVTDDDAKDPKDG